MKHFLKWGRNWLGDWIVRFLHRKPAWEPVFINVGLAVSHCPPLASLYRYTFDTLTDKLLRDERHNRYRKISIESVKFLFDVTDFTVKPWYFQGIPYEPATTDFLLSHLSAGSVFMDIGTNQGFFSILAGKVVGLSGHVYAFEPNPPVCEQLTQHIAANALEGVVSVSEIALADFNGEADFFVSTCPSNTGLSSLQITDDAMKRGLLSQDNATKVRVRTFDAWAETQGLGKITVIKVDVEGAEESVFRGMIKTLSNCPPRWIICETKWGGETAGLLEAHDYLPHFLDGDQAGLCNILFSLTKQ